MKVLPDGYYKSIFDINYKKLKENGIENLIFDVDDTLISNYDKQIDKKTLTFLKKLKKDFTIITMSNNRGKKIKYIEKNLNIKCISLSFKPFKRNYKKLSKTINIKNTIFIGNEIATDIFGAKRCNFKCILVDPISKKRPLHSFVYKFIELFVKDKEFKQGEYYEYYGK